MKHAATSHKLTLTKFVPEDQLELQKYIMISLMCCEQIQIRGGIQSTQTPMIIVNFGTWKCKIWLEIYLL